MIRKIAIVFQAIAVFIASSEVLTAGCAEQILKSVVTEAKFRKARSLPEIVTLLGIPFWKDFSELTNRDHVVDCGAGEIAALKQYVDDDALSSELSYAVHEPGAYSQMNKLIADHTPIEKQIWSHFYEKGYGKFASLDTKAWTTGITLQFENINPLRYEKHRGKLRILVGDFEKISVKKIHGKRGPATLGFDVMGLFAYNSQPGRVVRKDLQMLAVGKRYHFYIGRSDDPGNLNHHLVRTPSGTISLIEWISRQFKKQFRGITQNALFGLPETQSFSIERTPGPIPKPKDLKLVEVVREIKVGNKIQKLDPPRRIFEEVAGP